MSWKGHDVFVSDKKREKRLEAKNPKYYSVGVNAMSPFAVPEQTENKRLGDPVRSDLNRRAVPSMSYRHKPSESLPSTRKRKSKKR